MTARFSTLTNTRAVSGANVREMALSEADGARATATVSFTLPLEPIGKPRITRQGRWSKSAQAYYVWANQARKLFSPTRLLSDPHSIVIRAYFTMPKSWSKKKRAEMAGQPHRSKPDWDNVAKCVQDSFWSSDQVIAFGSCAKFWDDGNGARVEVEVR